MKFDSQTYQLSEASGQGKRLIIAGIVVMMVSALGYFIDSAQFYFSYLIAYVFWVSIGLGALFFVMLQHLTGAVWSLVLRRLTESIMIVLPYMFILFLPIVFGMHELYHWSRPEVVQQDALISQKTGYLNVPFFLIRNAIYFTSWFLIARALYKTSIAQDQKPDHSQITTMRKVSAPGMVVFAITTSFAAFDWLMSLDAHWFSTIFGLYFFAGGFLSALAGTTLISILLAKQGVLQDVITREHYHDLGKLLFGFVIFWGYMAFSQYFLIWYANIPEETIWYLHRWEGSWKIFSLTLVFGHFLIPFLLLMGRSFKRNLTLLSLLSAWILIMHWIDLYWIAMPVHHHHGIHLSWLDFTLLGGMGAVFLGIFWQYFSSKRIVPIGEQELDRSIQFINN